MGFRTKCVHTGVNKDSSYNSVITPIYPTSTFKFDKVGVNKGYDYTRSGNPTRQAAAENIAALENGEISYCTSTGMSACVGVLHLLKPGDHVITGNDIYGGTYRLMADIFTRLNIEFDFINMSDPANVKHAIKKNTKMIWIETPSNPLLNVVDINSVSKIGKAFNAIIVVDNTFMSPYFQRPLDLGADIVVHSTTKYINGHSDVVGGAIVIKTKELGDKVGYLVNALGIAESPFDAWLVLRGIKTLPLRMMQHGENALAVAEFLENHKNVRKVYYPGLKSHPQSSLIKEQMSGFGGMLSFEIKKDILNIDDIFRKLKYFSLAESLGGVESLAESPFYMSHASMNLQARKKAGITKELIRLSIGIENKEDLIKDLENALKS